MPIIQTACDRSPINFLRATKFLLDFQSANATLKQLSDLGRLSPEDDTRRSERQGQLFAFHWHEMNPDPGIQRRQARLATSDDAAVSLAPYAIMVWRTASGRRIPHTVYSLVGCPALQAATYLFVHRSPDGKRTILAVGRTRSEAPTLNLARIRHQGACLGANEVHINASGASDSARADVELDLALAHTGIATPAR